MIDPTTTHYQIVYHVVVNGETEIKAIVEVDERMAQGVYWAMVDTYYHGKAVMTSVELYKVDPNRDGLQKYALTDIVDHVSIYGWVND